jgi:hypothetical protein
MQEACDTQVDHVHEMYVATLWERMRELTYIYQVYTERSGVKRVCQKCMLHACMKYSTFTMALLFASVL